MSEPEASKRMVGGSSAERGLDFQARVSAIVMANMLTERSMGWLSGVLKDQPQRIDAETGGPGDDIRFVCDDGQIVEVQAKRGLKLGQDLWDALLALAMGVGSGRIAAGLLAVCPNSSGTIKSTLADDIVRIGTGRTDGLREPGCKFVEKLSAKSIDVTRACRAIRIVTIAAVDGNREAETAACERLARVAQDPVHAWTSLTTYSRRLIEIRGGATLSSLARELALCNVQLITAKVETAVQVQFALGRWLVDTHSQMSILGIARSVSLADAWIALKATVVDADEVGHHELDKALSQYHEYASGTRHGERTVDSHTLGRFVKRAVVLGGPGIGKSTLLKKLALEYSKDGYLVLLAKMPQVAALMKRDGRRFEDCFTEVALSGSGLRVPPSVLHDAVVLCDALDECGNLQSIVTTALQAFAAGHPAARVLVTSRPIGYQPGLIGDWRHYELQPLEHSEAESAISVVLDAIPFASAEKRATALELAYEQLKARHIKGVAARSPLMLTLIAALVANGIEPSTSRAALYRQLFRLIEDHPPTRMSASPPNEPERTRFLELLGWSLIEYGNEPSDQTLARCSSWWSAETGKGRMACETRVQECLSYWEGLGVVERVRTSTEEALTFVHKTFGEFAAGRYISRCSPVEQRTLLAKAIGIPEWKETLSFASHLGLAAMLLDVWTALALSGNSKAAYGLEDAIELIIQSGVPVPEEPIRSFVECCWAVVENNTSRTRFAGGDALCKVARYNFQAIRESAFANLQASDDWLTIVAWACACNSKEENLPYEELLELLRTLDERWPKQSYLGGFNFSATGHTVRESLILGAARHVLRRAPDEGGVEFLDALLMQPDSFSTRLYSELQVLYRKAGRKLPKEKDSTLNAMNSFLPELEAWKAEAVALLETIDDPTQPVDAEDLADEHMLELGAFLTATSFWEMGVGATTPVCSSAEQQAQRRSVIQLSARIAGIDLRRLVAQARAKHVRLAAGETNARTGLFDLPRVDVEPDFDGLNLSAEMLQALEEVIIRDGEYYGLNAAQLLHSYRMNPAYRPTIERLFENGKGTALYFASVLAKSLPEEQCQRLLLDKLTSSPLTRGCRHLYSQLNPPFGAEHEAVVLRALTGSDPIVAIAAAKITSQLDLSPGLVIRLRACFEEWKTKEEPYPERGGAVPDSPRDELAKLLVREMSMDHAFLISLACDIRSDVRAAALDPLTAAMTDSVDTQDQVLLMISSGDFDALFLRRTISAGVFVGEDALKIVPLLSSGRANVRFAALPILSSKYLPIQLAREEAVRLISDPELEVREGACKALQALVNDTSERE